ncbi:MAG TPA: hypothetical protein VL949_08585 [Geobacteraceae bacterium]|nr:hypothetical protein [Geobacteraceae bacterium]
MKTRFGMAGLLLAVIVGMQLAVSVPRLTLPFVDTRIHYNIDNAMFTFCARNGILLNTPKTQLGLTFVRHSAWGKPSGEVWYYSHLPFLFKALFQLYVRMCGDAEWVSRSFGVSVAIIATAGIFTSLLVASESLLATFLGTAVLIGTPAFTLNQACIRQEIDGMAVAAWFFVAVALYLRRTRRTYLMAAMLLAALSGLAHWTGLLMVIMTVCWLSWERVRNGDREAGRAALAAGTGAFSGVVAVVATLAWLNGGWRPFATEILTAASSRSGAMEPLGPWIERQQIYLEMNFGRVLLWSISVLAVGLAARWVWSSRKSKPRNSGNAAARLLPAFLSITSATAFIWLVAFREGSYVHSFWQLWLCLPIASLVVLAIVTARSSVPLHSVAVTAAGALAVWLQVASWTAYRELLENQMGNTLDIALLKSVRNDQFSRFVFIPVEQHPFNNWFQGPVFEYYTDRNVVTYDGEVQLDPGDKALLMLHENQETLVAEIGKQLHVVFSNAKCGPDFCIYDVTR